MMIRYLPLTITQPTIRSMKKPPTKLAQSRSGRRMAAKATPPKLVAVKKAAQRPTHATRAVIRRVVRSKAASQGANA